MLAMLKAALFVLSDWLFQNVISRVCYNTDTHARTGRHMICSRIFCILTLNAFVKWNVLHVDLEKDDWSMWECGILFMQVEFSKAITKIMAESLLFSGPFKVYIATCLLLQYIVIGYINSNRLYRDIFAIEWSWRKYSTKYNLMLRSLNPASNWWFVQNCLNNGLIFLEASVFFISFHSACNFTSISSPDCSVRC